MKLKTLLGWSSALFLSATIAQAQETKNADEFNKKLQELQERFDRQQRELRENFERQQRELRESFEKMNRDQQAQIEALKKQIAVGSTNAQPATNTEISDQIKELNDKVDSVVEAQTKTRPNEFNPSIGLVGETIFSYRSKGSQDTGSDRPGGFDVFQRSVELNVAASVDPFAKGYVVANASADSATGEATLGIEEAALQTTSLPWNLELKAGRFFGEFGRLGYIHDHELPFVNRPLVLDQYIGGESRTDGAQINWLLPVPHYFSLTLGVGDGFGGDVPPSNPGTYRPLSGLTYFGRLSTFFNLTPNWNIETGVSGLINPTEQDRGGTLAQSNGSTLTEKERRLAGFDFKLNWVPLQNNQFKGFTWGTEVLYSGSRFLIDPDGSLNPANPTPGSSGDEFLDTIGSLGLYSYATYKWSRQWSAGFLFDYVQSAENHDDVAFAYSPYITFALSHWNQLRLQYTHTDHNAASGLKPDDAVYFQWAWIIGSHAHGWQQR
jgi:acyl-CoA-binding protein